MSQRKVYEFVERFKGTRTSVTGDELPVRSLTVVCVVKSGRLASWMKLHLK